MPTYFYADIRNLHDRALYLYRFPPSVTIVSKNHFLFHIRYYFLNLPAKVWDCSATYFRPITYFGKFSVFCFRSFPFRFHQSAAKVWDCSATFFRRSIYLEYRASFLYGSLQEQSNQMPITFH
jgi:hypothetical protein